MSSVSDTILDAVEAVLPADGNGLRPRDVTGTIYSLISVRHALRELVVMGRARSEGPDCHKHYWRVAR